MACRHRTQTFGTRQETLDLETPMENKTGKKISMFLHTKAVPRPNSQETSIRTPSPHSLTKMKPKKQQDHNKKIRDSIPKNWIDICDLIPKINYLLVEEFYKNEYNPNIKTWKADPTTKKFSKWLESFYKFIKVEKPKMERELLNSIPDVPLNKWFKPIKKDPSNQNKPQARELKSCQEIFGKNYKQVYGKSNHLEEKLTKLETKFLKELIEYRSFFWT